MSGSYCLRWTPWRVWIHPRRAGRRLNEADETEEDLKKRLDEALALLEQQRKETALQTFRTSELSRRLAETEKRLTDEHRDLEETRHELVKARDLLEEHKTVDEKLMEFDRQLSKIEALKRSYEKRIAELQSRLADARKRLAEADDNELVEKIDMSAADRIRALYCRPVSKRKPEPKPDMTLRPDPAPENNPDNKPDNKTDDKGADIAKEVAVPKKKAKRPYDDWLTELPDF